MSQITCACTYGVQCFLGLLHHHPGRNIHGELLDDVVEEL